jgi:glutamate-5-semialdehyde dehydrogenase
VTSDCAALCIKSGNAAILKGGREAFYSNQAIYKIIQQALLKAKLPKECVSLIASTDRAAIAELLKLDEYVDVIVPRGGESLIRYVVENTRIAVIKHFKGVCHVYVSKNADLKMAQEIVLNAKLQKPGVCNAMETLLIDQGIAKRFLPNIADQLMQNGCQLRGDKASCALVKGMSQATLKDWTTEYLDLILSVRIVNGVNQAIAHINTYGSKHSDAIITKNSKEAAAFLKGVDSACVYVNASTRFTDGFEFGFGSEVGISTDKMHVRGPMALDGLTSYKYQIFGTGQVRQ